MNQINEEEKKTIQLYEFGFFFLPFCNLNIQQRNTRIVTTPIVVI